MQARKEEMERKQRRKAEVKGKKHQSDDDESKVNESSVQLVQSQDERETAIGLRDTNVNIQITTTVTAGPPKKRTPRESSLPSILSKADQSAANYQSSNFNSPDIKEAQDRIKNSIKKT